MTKKKSCGPPSAEDQQGAAVDAIQQRYGEAARRVSTKKRGKCCGGDNAPVDPEFITRELYEEGQIGQVPAEAFQASLGCGNPTALAELEPGEVVLDLGSGGGIDVILSARRVGPTGKAYGLDMTEDMLSLARENQRKAGVTNVEFLEGRIEAIPLPDASVDVVISNCVLNLSLDKPKALAEAFRVLKPGGRFAVSDIVVRGEMPAEIRRNLELFLGCVAGAFEEEQYARMLREAGFVDVSIAPTRIYTAEDAREVLAEAGLDPALAEKADARFMSAFVRARKPG